MIPISVINTSASFANQLAGVQKLGAQADRDHLRGLARCYAASYGFGWYHYQHDPAALTIELTKRQVPIADQGANQWLPIARVCFGDFDPKGTKVSYMGVSGLTKWNWDNSKQRGAGVMRHLFEEGIHPDEAEEYIFNFKGGVTGIIDPPSFQWTPMLAFRSWRGVSDEREASGLSGDLQTRSG